MRSSISLEVELPIHIEPPYFVLWKKNDVSKRDYDLGDGEEGESLNPPPLSHTDTNGGVSGIGWNSKAKRMIRAVG